MTDPFDLPERELPEHVRRDALRRIMTEIDHEPPRRKSGLVPLLIAASVVILMAGATIVTTAVLGNKDHKVSTAGPHSTITTAPSGSAENGFGLYSAQRDWGTGAEMERCWSADHKPDTWTPMLRVERNNLVALLYRVANDLVFCQLTAKTITVKSVPYPAPPPSGTPARVMFITTEGTYAGVTAPGIDNLTIRTTSGLIPEPSAIGNGVFILPNSYKRTDTLTLRGFTVPDYGMQAADLPQPLPPSQRSSDPRGDRTSVAGQRLGNCLSTVNPPIADADWFAPGASIVTDDQQWAQLGVLGDALVWCSSVADDPHVYLALPPSTHSVQWLNGNKRGFAAVTPTLIGIASNPDVATVTLSQPGTADITANVDHGTFIVPGPGGQPLSGSKLTVKKANGDVIEQFTI
ncbi:hypothetical protein [Kutzneria chonburiensis]|uniref:Uncharacterized protein n=1 Tax=Kutzneria chonburiensis TaxID=1483604 RepID=A0ABV6N7J3_9PSEU|nr:hypothetical protein [Kutzneria chonburiensis]